MTEKILTVVVPTYNMEKYLDRCLTSLIVAENQMQFLEVLVINDGSKDRSSEIAHSYEDRYPGTFKVIDKENGNYGSCVNIGLNLAKGKNFRILDADDWFDSSALSSFLTFLQSHDADLIFTPYKCVYCDGQKQEILLPSGIEEGNIYSIDTFRPWAGRMHMQMHGMTFALRVLKKCGLKLTEGISYTDTEYCYYPLMYVETIVTFNKSLYQYFSGRENQTMALSSLQKNIPQLLCVFERMVKNECASNIKTHNDTCSVLSMILFKRVIDLFYWIVLLNSKKSIWFDEQLKQMDKHLLIIPELYTYSSSLSLNRLHYVSIWRKYGVYNTGFCGQVNNLFWSIICRIKRK